MRSFDNELNTQSQVGESQHSQESYSSNEMQNQSEQYLGQEMLASHGDDEINEKTTGSQTNNSNKNQNLSAKQLTQYLASVTVVITATATVVVPVITSVNTPTEPVIPPVEIVSETVGALSYKCAVGFNGEEIELDALLLTADGEEVVRQEDIIIKNGEQANLDFQRLQPEFDYEINMIDSDGEVVLERQFTTDDIITIEQATDNTLKLNLHQDLNGFMEVWVELLSENGNDFTGNIVYDDNGQIFLYKQGLFASNYQLQVRCFFDEAEYAFPKTIALGDLTPLEYQATAQSYGEAMDIKHEIALNFKSGDFGGYTINGVTIYSDDYEVYHSFYQEDYALDGNDIFITVYELIASGEYNVCVWGELIDGEMSFYNQIWLGKIVI